MVSYLLNNLIMHNYEKLNLVEITANVQNLVSVPEVSVLSTR